MATFLKDLSGVGFAKAAIIVFSFIRGIILARWLGPENNGIIAALAVYPSLFMTFGSLGISQSTTYFVGKKIYDESSIKTAISQIWFVTAIISTITCFLLIRYFSNYGGNIIWVILSVAPIPFTLFTTYSSGVFLGKNQIKAYNRINWIPPFVVLIAVIVLIVFLKYSINGALIASVIGSVFMFVILLFKNDFLKAFSLKINFTVIGALFRLGLVYALALLVINLNYKVDIIILDEMSSAYELGIYSKGVTIIDYLWQIPMLMSTIVFARSAGSKDGFAFSVKVAQLLRISFVVIGFVSILLIVFAKFLITSLYGIPFENSAAVLIILTPGIFLLTIFKVLNMDLAGKGKPMIAIKAMIPSLLINVVLNILLIPQYGANGSSMASTISYSISAILFIHFYSKETKLPVRQILHYRKSDFDPILNVLKRKNK